MKVLKRNGKLEDLNLEKLRKVVYWAKEKPSPLTIDESNNTSLPRTTSLPRNKGLDLNILELESKMHIKFFDGISTKEIHETAVNTALSLTSIEKPEWSVLAARLFIYNLYKEVSRVRGTYKLPYINWDKEYPKVVKDLVEKGVYTEELIKEYTEEELSLAGSFINIDYDFIYDFAGANLLAKRYLCVYDNHIYELPQEMYMSIALMLAIKEKKEERLKIAKEYYNLIAGKKISLATPILINLRRPKGNLSSCFILAMDDNLDSIMYSAEAVAQISKRAGGVGVNLSRIRGHGSWIKNVFGASGGVVPWIKILNDVAVAVNQEGKRAGAITVALDIWHIDILDFLEIKTEMGDLRKKAFDVFPQVVIPDLFMQYVKENKNWLIVDPYEINKVFNIKIWELYGKEFERYYHFIEQNKDKLRLKKEINAKELFKQILKVQIATGLPYIFFKDTVNKLNPLKHDGYIANGNLCMESFSNFRPSEEFKSELKDGTIIRKINKPGLIHTCNLLSLNLANIEDEELEYVVRKAVRILDSTIDLTEPPILESKLHNERYRTIGIGAMGLADFLAKRNLTYSRSSIPIIDELFEKIAYFGIDESCNLAKEKGPFPAFKGSDWDNGIIFGKDKFYLLNYTSLKEKWENLLDKIKEHGLRNGQIFAIAPNTSSGLLQGATPGILPPFSKFYIDKNQKQSVPVFPPFIKERFWYYKELKNMDPREIVDIVATIQKWVDSGISMELLFNLNLDIKAKDIYETIFRAWEKGLKTVYYVRTIQKDSTVMSEKEECVSCAN